MNCTFDFHMRILKLIIPFKHYYIPSLGDPFAQCQRAMNIHVNGNVFTYIIYVAYVFVNCSHHYLSLKAQLP